MRAFAHEHINCLLLLFPTQVGPELKLIDFGISKKMATPDDTSVVRDEQVGSANYMSPESILGEAPVEGKRSKFKVRNARERADCWLWSLTRCGTARPQIGRVGAGLHSLRNRHRRAAVRPRSSVGAQDPGHHGPQAQNQVSRHSQQSLRRRFA